MIYIVNGYPCSGKTTFEDYVCKIVGDGKYGFKISTIDFVKDIARQCGWNGEKDLKNRVFLSNLKKVLTNWDDVPNKKVIESINEIKLKVINDNINFDSCAIFVDCREPNEIKKLCKLLNAKSILIRRENDENTETSNESDENVLDYTYDIIINNYGSLLALADKAIEFAEYEHLHIENKTLY